MTDNPLIADNRPEGDADILSADNLDMRSVPGSDEWEGAGPVSGFASALQNLERGDLSGVGFDLGGVAFDALGLIENPMRVCLAAGIGWLIEHFGIFNEILSVMAGDPNQVADQAQTWTNVGDQVTARVRDLQALVDRLPATSGAVDRYRIAVADFAKTVDISGHAAYTAANGTNSAATVVATTRSVIRDWFADWASGRVMMWLGIGPLTPMTFGGAQAAFIADSVVSGTRVAARATKELRRLVKHLDEMGDGLKTGSRSLTDAADALRKGARMPIPSGPATKAANALGRKRPRIPGEDELIGRMKGLEATAGKHVDDVKDATDDVAAAAAKRADAGKSIGSRKAPNRDHANKAAHATAKQQQKFADAKLANRAERLSEVSDEARDIAADAGRLKQKLVDDEAKAAAKAAEPTFRERAEGLVTATVKEAMVQTSNEDLRAHNAQSGYVDQYKERHGQEPPAPEEEPVAGNDESRTGPPEPGGAGTPPPDPDAGPPTAQEAPEQAPPPSEPTVTTTGPAPQPVRQETWQVRGTLDP